MARPGRVHKSSEGLSEKLEAIHRTIAVPAGHISGMISRRRLNMAALQEAAAQLKLASETFDKLLEALKQEI